MTYKEFIDDILQTRGRFGCRDEYHERHHIVPKCMGGGNDEENLIDLYAREHFEAHRLLALENPDDEGLVYAWWCMSVQTNQYTKERYKITAEEYEEVRKIYAQTLSKNMYGENNHFYGRKHSDETKNKIKKNHADLSGSKHIKAKHVLQYDLYGNFIKEWDCITTAAKELHIDRHLITRCAMGNSVTAHGYLWFYSDGFTYDQVVDKIKQISNIKEGRRIRALTHNPFKGKHHSNKTKKKIKDKKLTKPIICIESNIIYQSIMDAERATNIHNGSISACCKGKVKTAGGYQWKYLYDQTQKDGTVIPGAITLGLITEEEALRMLEEQKEMEGEG